MRTRHIVIAAVTIAAAFLVAGAGAPLAARAEDPQPGTITVMGTGTVSSVPDTATISFGVVTQATTAAQAMSANTTAAERMIAAVKGAGIDSKDDPHRLRDAVSPVLRTRRRDRRLHRV